MKKILLSITLGAAISCGFLSVAQAATNTTSSNVVSASPSGNKTNVTQSHPTVQKQTNQQKVAKPVDSLQQVINGLSDKDRKIVLDIQQEVSTWPKNLFEELEGYREFILTARKEAKERYDALSPQAKNALKIERGMKQKLSQQAVDALEDLNPNHTSSSSKSSKNSAKSSSSSKSSVAKPKSTLPTSTPMPSAAPSS